MKRKNPARVAVDSWAFVKGDAENKLDIRATMDNMRESWKGTPGLSVRQFKREIRAGGASIPVVAVVASALRCETTDAEKPYLRCGFPQGHAGTCRPRLG